MAAPGANGVLGTITGLKMASARVAIDDHFESKDKATKAKLRKSVAMAQRSSDETPARRGALRGSISNARASIANAVWGVSDGTKSPAHSSSFASQPSLAWPGEVSSQPGLGKDYSCKSLQVGEQGCKSLGKGYTDESLQMGSAINEPDFSWRVSTSLENEWETSASSASKALQLRKHATKMLSTSTDRTISFGSTETNGCRGTMKQLVLSPKFDFLIALAVFSNTVYIGLQTDFLARWGADATFLTIDRIVDTCFCSVFLVEILIKVYVYQTRYLQPPAVGWNLFDCCVVIGQMIELTISWLAGDELMKNLANLRILRVLRILRAIRIIRLVKLLRPLRILVMSILSSLQPLFWTVMLLFFLIYIVGIFITQSVADFKSDQKEGRSDDTSSPQDMELLDKYFGDLSKAMLSLFQAVSGGVDWRDMVDPLMVCVSPLMGFIFSVYIAFSILALMNVVSGYFVQSALENSKREQENYMLSLVRQVLKKLDVDKDGQITWAEFADALELKEMQEYFKTVDVDISDAQSLWNLLDADGVGCIDAEMLLNGCLQLQGPASALSQKLVIREMGRVFSAQEMHAAALEEHLADMEQFFEGKPKAVVKKRVGFEQPSEPDSFPEDDPVPFFALPGKDDIQVLNLDSNPSRDAPSSRFQPTDSIEIIEPFTAPRMHYPVECASVGVSDFVKDEDEDVFV